MDDKIKCYWTEDNCQWERSDTKNLKDYVEKYCKYCLQGKLIKTMRTKNINPTQIN